MSFEVGTNEVVGRAGSCLFRGSDTKDGLAQRRQVRSRSFDLEKRAEG